MPWKSSESKKGCWEIKCMMTKHSLENLTDNVKEIVQKEEKGKQRKESENQRICPGCPLFNEHEFQEGRMENRKGGSNKINDNIFYIPRNEEPKSSDRNTH